jgi:hypothetical protein
MCPSLDFLRQDGTLRRLVEITAPHVVRARARSPLFSRSRFVIEGMRK